MNKVMGTFVKGVATGMAVGTAVSMIGNPFHSRKHTHMKKNASKALRAVGELVQNAQYMMK
jgi:gas vesicle protein